MLRCIRITFTRYDFLFCSPPQANLKTHTRLCLYILRGFFMKLITMNTEVHQKKKITHVKMQRITLLNYSALIIPFHSCSATYQLGSILNELRQRVTISDVDSMCNNVASYTSNFHGDHIL